MGGVDMIFKVCLLYATVILLASSTKEVNDEVAELMQKLTLMNPTGKTKLEEDVERILAVDTDPNTVKIILKIKEAFEERRKTLVIHRMEAYRLFETEYLKIIQEKLEMLMSKLYQPKAKVVVKKTTHPTSGTIVEMTLQHNNGYASLRFDAFSHTLKILSL